MVKRIEVNGVFYFIDEKDWKYYKDWYNNDKKSLS
jgi:hypothetical protein